LGDLALQKVGHAPWRAHGQRLDDKETCMSHDPTQPTVIGQDPHEQLGESPAGSGPMMPDDTQTNDTQTKDVAQDKARDVASNAKASGGQVADTAKGEADRVAAEAKGQARDLMTQARGEFAGQASRQQERASSALHGIAAELGSMADNSENPGAATDLTRQAADRAHSMAGWLDSRQPSELLDDVKDFAQRRPGAFLAAAAAVGFVAGRLTRGLADDARSDDPGDGGQSYDDQSYDALEYDDDPSTVMETPAGVDAQLPAVGPDASIDAETRSVAR
jgi:hypothetical protein